MKRERLGLEMVALCALSLWLAMRLELIAERAAALLLAVVGAATIASFVYRSICDERGRERRHLAALLAATTASVALLPVATSLAPGDPLLESELHEGEHLAIPAEIHGPVRVVVHTDLAPTSHQPIAYAIDGLPIPLRGHFERVGDEGSAVPNVHDTDVRSLDLEGAGDLYVRSVDGVDQAALEVTVFRERWPMRHEVVLALLLLAVTAIYSLRHREAATLFPVVVGATLFGLLVVRWLTPVAPLGQEVSAIAVATLMGAACHAPWRWLVARRWGRRGTAPT